MQNISSITLNNLHWSNENSSLPPFTGNYTWISKLPLLEKERLSFFHAAFARDYGVLRIILRYF